MSMLKTTGEVVIELGGDEAVAALCGATTRAVRFWRSSKQFPPKTFMVISAALGDIGKSADPSLWGFIKPPSGAEPTPPPFKEATP